MGGVGGGMGHTLDIDNKVKNDVVKNITHNELVKKVNTVDLSKQNLEKNIEDFEKGMHNTS